MTPVRQGPEHTALEDALARLAQLFAGAGHTPVAVAHLFEAEALIDLYGEDIRARAFLFPGAGGGGELCLRPDFTVPVVRAHGANGWERRARYSYQGPVFRRQPPGSTRPTEYLQAGIEDLGNPDRAEAVAGPGQPGPLRAQLLQAARDAAPADAIAALATEAGEPVGLREIDEIVARTLALAEAANDPAMPRADADLIEAALAIQGPAGNALARLRALTAEADVNIAPALDRFEARLAALDRAGIDAAALPFDAAFGRNLEYYEGFVFEVTATGREGLPPLAGGGRYDAMTRRLGAAEPVPAVGAMIRPEAVLAAKEAQPEGRP